MRDDVLRRLDGQMTSDHALAIKDIVRKNAAIEILYFAYFLVLTALVVARGWDALVEFPSVLILIIPFLLLTLKSPVAGLVLFMLYQLTQLKSLAPSYGEFLSLSILAEICLFIALAFQFLLRRRISGFSGALPTLVCLYLCIYIVTAIWRSSPAPGGEGGPLKEFVLPLFLFLCFIAFIDSWEKLLPMLRSLLLLSLFWFGAAAFHVLRFGEEALYLRTSVEQGYLEKLIDVNVLAVSVLMIMPLIYFLWFLPQSGSWRFLAAAGLVLSVFTVILTFSRNGFVGLAVVMVLLFFERRRSPKILSLFLIIILIILFVPSSYWNRIATITSLQVESGLRLKISHVIRGLSVVVHHPILGIGLGRLGYSVHNSLLQVAAEAGLPTLFVFLGILYYAFMELKRAQRFLSENAPKLARLPRMLSISLIAFLIGGLTISIHHLFLLIVILGLIVALRNLCREGVSLPEERAG
jgi:hypothetical protein